MATNSFKGKYHEGLFANHEGPIQGQQITKQAESTGLLSPATSGRHLKTVGGSGELLAGMPSDRNFDLHSKSYKGPQNWTPTDQGVSNPSDVNK